MFRSCSRSLVLVVSLAPIIALGACGGGAKSELNAPFRDPGLDPAPFVERFEGESREIAKHHEEIADALELREGMTIGDIGAGTGLFMEPFARRVGAGGRVYAVDISESFVEFMRKRAAEAGLAQVDVRLCSDRSVDLPDASLDVAFVCDTYHHFEHPAATLASLHRALRPGGRLVIVDFERIPGTSRDWVLDHVRCGRETVIAECEAAGFVVRKDTPRVALEENYLVEFDR